jgi:spermidine synthase
MKPRSLAFAAVPVAATQERSGISLWPYYLVFFVSGFPALLYQIVWERALFTIYGVNIESVTIIVTVFLLGLGLGSLAGGRLSEWQTLPCLRVFGVIELSIGVFGAVSLSVFHGVASYTAGASTLATGALTFLLVLVPTLLMGSTLPLLTAHLVRRTRNVGESVGALYCANTLGSAAACFAAAAILMRVLGQSGSVRLAAVINGIVGLTALLWSMRTQSADGSTRYQPSPARGDAEQTIHFGTGMLLAGAVGFISLAYEIIWYRVYSFTSGGSASCFAKMLAFYLAGIAYGSFAVRDVCREKPGNNLSRTLGAASTVVLLGSLASFLLGPALAYSASFLLYDLTFPFVFVGAALLGSAFPLLSHASIDPQEPAGRRLSYLYLSNIVGSALGSFLVGFVILDHCPMQMTSALLLVLGVTLSVILALCARPMRWSAMRVTGWAGALVLASFSGVLFSQLYERLLFHGDFAKAAPFQDLVENRSGVIAEGPDGTVYGGGVYDGQFNTDLTDDQNGIFRAYAIGALHPLPQDVLVIGLASGSWAQVLAHHPLVRHMTIVEINPGYLKLIAKHPNVASLLHNPKVKVEIDDARRWLTAHPHRRFDFILMNTTFHWRANASNLLSREFLQLLRSHLQQGGVAYYNTTGSSEVLATGISVFPYALRFSSFLAVSDQPLAFDRVLWQQILVNYRIDDKPVIDLSKERDRERLEEVLALPDRTQERSGGPSVLFESRSTLVHRLRGVPSITDDNMGAEWK